MGCRTRSRQRAQRVIWWQPGPGHAKRSGRAGRPGGRRGGRHGCSVQRRRWPVQQHRFARHGPRRDLGRRNDHIPGLSADHPVRHAARAGWVGGQQHHRLELLRHLRVQPADGGRRCPGDRGWSLCSSNTTRFSAAPTSTRAESTPDLGRRRNERLRARDLGHGSARDRGLRQHPWRHHAVPALVQRIIASTADRPGCSRRPSGCRPGQHA